MVHIAVYVATKSAFTFGLNFLGDTPSRYFDARSYIRGAYNEMNKTNITIWVQHCSWTYDVSKIAKEVEVNSGNLCYDPCAPLVFFFAPFAVRGCSVNRPYTNDRFFNDNPTLELVEILQESGCLLRGQHFIALFIVCPTSHSVSGIITFFNLKFASICQINNERNNGRNKTICIKKDFSII